MRLWHKDIISFLPRTQLLSQWRELNLIYTQQPSHILINYIYDYPKQVLYNYSCLVLDEFKARNYTIRNLSNFNAYFDGINTRTDEMFKEHDIDYLTVCYWNLYEKHLRKQKDFNDETWERLDKFYKGGKLNEIIFKRNSI